MKVLILTCSTGGGHNSCARYLKEEFNDHGIPCDYQDYFDIVGKKASQIAEKIYLDTTKNNGLIFKGVYRLGELYDKTPMPSPVYGLNKLIKEKLYKFICDNGYDLIIGTHLFPCIALTAIKKEHDIKFVNVATDYECIPFWSETNPDVFVIPAAELKERFIAKGVKPDCLFPFGIPVASRFFQKAKQLAIPAKSILLTSGSMGFGKMVELTKAILNQIPEYTLIVICGNNRKLQAELTKIKDPNLKVLGFVNNINDYIKSCEIVMTKPGGLTTTEVAGMRKPLIHVMPIPGVENYNAAFFADHKMALRAENVNDAIKCAKELIQDKALQQEMVANQAKYINNYAAYELVEYLIKNY